MADVPANLYMPQPKRVSVNNSGSVPRKSSGAKKLSIGKNSVKELLGSPDQSNIIDTSSNGGKVKPHDAAMASEQNSSGSPQTV